MQLENDFTVPVPPDQVWEALLDVERIAPCMPGATLDSSEGETYNGRVKVKVGPITVTYRGQAKIVSRDDDNRVAEIEAKGKEARGSGTADARITARVQPSDDGTRVSVTTDLNITGRVAQTGRGMLSDVSGKLVNRFADNLATELTQPAAGGETQEAPTGGTTSAPGAAAGAGAGADAGAQPRVSRAYSVDENVAARPAQDEAIDLVEMAGTPVLKRVAIAAVAAVVGVVLLRWLIRRRRG
ncbi:SRPBCC family protein [Spiractinospora alimapuensis]|uniref:SRPBCC family protein n=1 Tax=Spiractinospora alimapuensis TaxID=2820884 RepID=UPI001F36E2B5|nr:SRPBCC family protein [Spiractinospora alimapuensis]